MDFTSIHNYYEHLVTDYMISKVIPDHPDKSTDFFLENCYVSHYLDYFYANCGFYCWLFCSQIKEELRLSAY